MLVKWNQARVARGGGKERPTPTRAGSCMTPIRASGLMGLLQEDPHQAIGSAGRSRVLGLVRTGDALYSRLCKRPCHRVVSGCRGAQSLAQHGVGRLAWTDFNRLGGISWTSTRTRTRRPETHYLKLMLPELLVDMKSEAPGTLQRRPGPHLNVHHSYMSMGTVQGLDEKDTLTPM